MRIPLAAFCLVLAGCATSPRPYQVEKPRPLPIALDKDFEFRKIKQYFLDPEARALTGQIDPSVSFERTYRMYGAITALDQHQRFGNYYTLFWVARRPAHVRLRLEYRQEKLHAFVQAREVDYPRAQGHHQTDFAIIGDDFYDDGRVIAWRASLIVDDRIVAMRRSYLWE